MVNTRPEPLTYQEEIVLEQLRRNHADSIDALDALDRKAQGIAQISSVIMTIITGFQLTSITAAVQAVNQSTGQVATQTADPSRLIIILAFYLTTFGSALWATRPRSYYREPIKANWDDIKEALELTPEDFYYRLLSGYEDSILRNQVIIKEKASFVTLAYILLGATVVVALVLSIAK